MADYSRQIATAQRMIRDKGRLVAFARTSTGPSDPDDPLAGPAPAPAPVTGIPAVFVSPGVASASLGYAAITAGLFKRCTQVALVASDGANDFTKFSFLTDTDNSTWKIEAVDKLAPAEDTILYFIGVRRP